MLPFLALATTATAVTSDNFDPEQSPRLNLHCHLLYIVPLIPSESLPADLMINKPARSPWEYGAIDSVLMPHRPLSQVCVNL